MTERSSFFVRGAQLNVYEIGNDEIRSRRLETNGKYQVEECDEEVAEGEEKKVV